MFQEFKGEAYQLQIEMERLNHQSGLLLKKVTEEADRCAIQEPMSELKMLWENLDEKIISRQVRRGKRVHVKTYLDIKKSSRKHPQQCDQTGSGMCCFEHRSSAFARHDI